MKISSDFDGGNIEVIEAENPSNIRLHIHKDNKSDFFQWFYFRMTGAKGQLCALSIEDVENAAYPQGWENYQAVASYDRKNWFRVSTVYKDGSLVIHHVPETDCVYYAYFAPYSMERHHDLIARCAADEKVALHTIGETLDGQDMDLLTIGTPKNQQGEDKKVIWYIARQHPGETMAEWFMEGMLERLLDDNDPVSRTLLDKCVFYAVPNMNPDGSRRGHLRTNAAGVNLNRVWEDPDFSSEPEVAYVRGKMDETGIDLVLDVHGDEALPYNFIACFEGIPDIDESQLDLAYEFMDQLARISPDFQTEVGYPKSAPGKANLTMATNQLAHRYNAVSMTLEMPFKDTEKTPYPETGWSPDRSAKLGKASLDALLAVLPRL